MTTILLSAGDLSGERVAADLVHELRKRLPDARFVGMGGSAMTAAGVEIFVDQRHLAVGGIIEILRGLPSIIRAWRGMLRCLRETRPDLVVLIDSGGFNLPFARRVRAISKAKILYYVAPQIWAWRAGRLQRLADRTDRIAVVLPFESAFYADHGVIVDWVGHPAVDALRSEVPSESPAQSLRDIARIRLGIEREDVVLGIYPGSRRNEIERHLPIQIEAFMRLRTLLSKHCDLRGVVVMAASLDRKELMAVAATSPSEASGVLRFVAAEDGSMADACDVALAKPGTITVELMLRGRPMVVVGRAHPLTAMVARRSVKIAWLAMPNLIAEEQIVPEFLQEDATGDRIAAALAPLFAGEARERQIAALGLVSERLGRAGAAERTAAIVEEMLGSASA
ncbi:MAG: lipid-A-disaccharide synthase [Myxococcota bacterium]